MIDGIHFCCHAKSIANADDKHLCVLVVTFRPIYLDKPLLSKEMASLNDANVEST